MHGKQKSLTFISNMWRQGWTGYQLALAERTHRGDRWRTVLESQYTYAHIQWCWQLCWNGSMWDLERWNVCPWGNALPVCLCGWWRQCCEGFMCLIWAIHGCVCVSAHHMFSSHNTYKPVKHASLKSHCYWTSPNGHTLSWYMVCDIWRECVCTLYPSIHSFSVIWHLFLISVGGAFSRCEAGIQHGQVTSPSQNKHIDTHSQKQFSVSSPPNGHVWPRG